MSELRGLQLRIQDFRAAGAELYAISPDSVEHNAGVVRKLELDYRVLSDEGLAATRAFDLVHAGGGPQDADIPRPATFIAEDGRVRWRHLTPNYRVRPDAEEVLAAVRDR